MDEDEDAEDDQRRRSLSDWLAGLTNRIVAACYAFYPVLAWIAKVCSFIGGTVLIASAIYLFVYYTLIGEEVVTRSLYFTFDSACKLTSAEAEDGAVYSACNFPLANASLDANRDQPGGLVYGQAYRVTVRLWLPDSRANRLVGMFLVRLQLYSHGYVPGASSLRPAVLPHRPWPARLVSDLAGAALGLVAGWDAEPRRLDVAMLDDYVENPFAMSSGLIVELQSRRIQVQRATVEFRARLTGLKYAMYSHPILSAFVGVPAIAWLILLATTPVLLRRWLSSGDAGDDDWLDDDGGGGGGGVGAGEPLPHPMPMMGPDPTRAELRHRQRAQIN